MQQVSTDELADQLRFLGVQPGGVLLVHASFRAVRPVERGPLGVIDALRIALGPDGTLVMPTMTDGESDPDATPSEGMGIIAELFWRQAGVQRSTHPGGSFAAEGPHAALICGPQPLSPPHGPDSPVGRVHELDGQVLLLGVSHGENTSLHLAESIAGVPYSVEHPCVVEIDGQPQHVLIAETDHCCTRFPFADAWLRDEGLQREGRVGRAESRLFRCRDVVRLAVARLEADPLLFLCPVGSGCEQCDAAHASTRS